jgi:hypothetical protein
MSRTITATERATIASLHSGHWFRLEVWDSTSTYLDYSTQLRGVDFVNTFSLEENIDSNSMSFSATLLRESGTLSLAPFMAASLLNQVGGSYATLLDLWRKFRLSISVRPEGYPPTGSDWKEMCQGRVDTIDTANEQISITGRDEGAVLLDKYIDTPRAYGSVGGIAMETVLQSMLDDNLGASAPTLYTPASPGFLMNGWTQPRGNLLPALQAVADKAGFVIKYRYDSANSLRLTLYKPNRTATVEDWTLGPSEYTAITLNKIDIKGVRNFIKIKYAHSTLGVQAVIYPHMAGTGTLTALAGAGTFSSSQAGIVQNGAVVIVAGIPYSISGFSGTTTCTLNPQPPDGTSSGLPTFGASAFTLHGTLSGAGTSTSLSRFGRRDMEIDLSFDTQVNDPTKAQNMADAVGPDMEFPNLEQQFETLGAWFIQLHDYGKFLANGINYDSDQLGGITSIHTEGSNGTIKTTIGARGKPSGKYTGWRMLGSAGGPVVPVSGTVALSARVLRISETATQVVVRVEVISPIVGALVTIAYDNGGLTVSPASGGTFISTTSFGTTAHIDYTITRDVYGGTPRRVTFTASAPGFIDATDGVDVTPINALTLTLSIGTCFASDAGSSGPPFNQLEVAFTFSGMPSGTTFDVGYNNGVSGGVGYTTGLTSSPATFTSVTFAASPGKGAITVIAQNAGVAIASKIKNATYVF